MNILGSQQPLEAESHQEGNGQITATNIYSKHPQQQELKATQCPRMTIIHSAQLVLGAGLEAKDRKETHSPSLRKFPLYGDQLLS